MSDAREQFAACEALLTKGDVEACAAAASKNTLATGNMCVLNSAPAVTKKHY